MNIPVFWDMTRLEWYIPVCQFTRRHITEELSLYQHD
jgi:hypothetical protein